MSQVHGTSAAHGCHGHNNHCHANNGHHKQLEELAQIVQQTIQQQMEQATQQHISEMRTEMNRPSETELANKPERVEKLIMDAKLSRGVDQGQALRELDALTGGQAATNALMRAIV